MRLVQSHPAMAPRFARRRWTVSLAALVPVALLLGFGTGWYMRSAAPGEHSPEVAFARDMTTHHTQAVDMALLLHDRTTDAQLRALTLDIVLTQQAQIGQMQGWLAIWNRSLAGDALPMNGLGERMGMATPEEVAQLGTLPRDHAEILFLQLMIRHHQGGVQMAQAALQRTTRPEVARLASAIVRAQQNELATMQELLTQRGAAPFPEAMTPGEHHP